MARWTNGSHAYRPIAGQEVESARVRLKVKKLESYDVRSSVLQ